MQTNPRRVTSYGVRSGYIRRMWTDINMGCRKASKHIQNGSPSRMQRVRRISLEITICPRSSTRRTIPVVFVYLSPFLWHPSAPSLRGLARASRDWGSVLFKNDTPSVFATLSHLPHRGRQGHLQYFSNCAVSICKLRSIIPQYLLFDFAVI